MCAARRESREATSRRKGLVDILKHETPRTTSVGSFWPEMRIEDGFCDRLCHQRRDSISNLAVLSFYTAPENVIITETLQTRYLAHAEAAGVLRVCKRAGSNVERSVRDGICRPIPCNPTIRALLVTRSGDEIAFGKQLDRYVAPIMAASHGSNSLSVDQRDISAGMIGNKFTLTLRERERC